MSHKAFVVVLGGSDVGFGIQKNSWMEKFKRNRGMPLRKLDRSWSYRPRDRVTGLLKLWKWMEFLNFVFGKRCDK